MLKKIRSFTQDGDVQIIEQKTAYKGYFQINQLKLKFKKFCGAWSKPVSRELFQRKNTVGALLFDPKIEKLVFIEQFRVGALNDQLSPWLIEIVAGIVESGETEEEVAKREVYEETGLAVSKLKKICGYWSSPGASDEYLTIFFAEVNTSGIETISGLADEEEDIKAHLVSIEEAKDWLASGLLNNAAILIAFQWFLLHYQKA
ncbi:MAG: hypothetical protein A3E87_09680 [Gammaproteobacteria bacterium RIFCSPHIGHO2_12_FULL_35_23]|nr:MAG: hypothetical protein A3E87_09680 [Gammaproteobacteria bacterium RIFCSPHIGHO2_12_FULL_35_23]